MAIFSQILCAVVSIAVLSGIVVILVLFGSGSQNGNLFSFNDLFAGYNPVYPATRFLASGSLVWRSSFDAVDCLQQFDTQNNVVKTLFCTNSTIFEDENITLSDFALSFDGSHILLPFHQQQIWRHSFRANYLIVELNSSKTFWLGNTSDPANPKIQSALWNPASNQIAYIIDNNICVTDSGFLCQSVTNDGDVVLNGIASWVYEEEVLSSGVAMWWSPKGDYLAFFKTNESSVGTFSIPFYEGADLGYTKVFGIRYPKAGTPNPVVAVCVYYTVNKTISDLVGYSGEYVTDLAWKDSITVTIRTEDRSQQLEKMFLYDVSTTSSKLSPINSFTTQTATGGWIQPRPGVVKFLPDDMMALIAENSGYYHIALYSTKNGSQLLFLTNGTWDVTDIVGVNTVTNTLYYLSTEVGPTVSHVYGITFDGKQKSRLTSTDDAYYTALFNQQGTHFVLTYGGPTIPSTTLMKVTGDTSVVAFNLEDNSALAQKLAGFQLPKKQFFQISIPVSDENQTTITLNAWLLVPPRLRSQNFPLLMNVYGGPGSQTVTKQWSLGFNDYLASTLNIAIASVDPRGTGNRGVQFMQQTYLKLGIIESHDIAVSAVTIAKMFDNLDPNRLGIWGWSYGGYMTLMSLINVNPSPFKVGVSVAPVTDWHLYDTFYTERFMSTPASNADGYNKTSVINLVNRANLADNKLLLIHGTGDDNVHLQNSMELNRVLVSEGIQYDTMVYANQNHAINTNGSRQHLYKKISSYLEKFL